MTDRIEIPESSPGPGAVSGRRVVITGASRTRLVGGFVALTSRSTGPAGGAPMGALMIPMTAQTPTPAERLSDEPMGYVVASKVKATLEGYRSGQAALRIVQQPRWPPSRQDERPAQVSLSDR